MFCVLYNIDSKKTGGGILLNLLISTVFNLLKKIIKQIIVRILDITRGLLVKIIVLIKKKATFFNTICVISIIVMICISFAHYKNIEKLKENEKTIIAEKSEIRSEKKSLENEVSKLYSDDEYLIRYAREHYIFLKEDEHVVELPNIQNFQNIQDVQK